MNVFKCMVQWHLNTLELLCNHYYCPSPELFIIPNWTQSVPIKLLTPHFPVLPAPGNHCLLSVFMTFPILEIHINGIIQYVFFCTWCLSVHLIPSRFTCDVACGMWFLMFDFYSQWEHIMCFSVTNKTNVKSTRTAI